MRLLAFSFLALAVVTTFAGCATGDRAHYTRSQQDAQHAVHDPVASAYR